MKEDALKAMGLNSKEAQVYLACLRLGSSLVQDIAISAKQNRTSTYDLLSSLEEKGFVSFTISSGKKHYQATNPRNLLGLFREKEKIIEESLPELDSLLKSYIEKPKIEVFLGKNGLKTLFEGILKESNSFYCIASKKQLFELFTFYFPHFVERRKKKGIKVKILSNEMPFDKDAPYKIIKKPLKTATWIYSGKIVMVSLEEAEPIGIMIDEKNFYETQKALFEIIWDNI